MFSFEKTHENKRKNCKQHKNVEKISDDFCYVLIFKIANIIHKKKSSTFSNNNPNIQLTISSIARHKFGKTKRHILGICRLLCLLGTRKCLCIDAIYFQGFLQPASMFSP